MDLSNLIYVVAVLACPVGMGLMMWMMSRNMGREKSQTMATGQVAIDLPNERLVSLRTQKQALEVEIDELTQLAKLEAQRDILQYGDPQMMSTNPVHFENIEKLEMF